MTSLSVSPAEAAIFTDRAAFEAAATGLTNIGFEGIVPPGSYDIYAPGVQISGVTFSDLRNFTFILDRPPGDGLNYGTGAILYTGAGDNTITAQLPSEITAVGVDIFAYNLGTPLTIEISTGDSLSITTPLDRLSKFVGFTSTTPISFISFTSPNDGQSLDNLTFGQARATAVPAPALLPGLVGLGFSVLRRRKGEAATAEGVTN